MVIETQRLILRPWEENDAEDLYYYAKDERIGPAAGWPAHKNIEDSLKFIHKAMSTPEIYAVCLKETKRPIGCIALNFHSDLAEKNDEAELGYWVGVPFWGRGLIPEAGRAILSHAFLDLSLHRVWCGYYDGNLRSKKVQEKLGFRFVRITENAPVPQLCETRKGFVNCLTKNEWENSYKSGDNSKKL